ncbi:MAG: DmsE family decaheme c-type cytochrome, partial [Candidatus Acidiferrales bacterium]
MARFRVFGLAAIAALTLLGMQHGLAHAQEKQNAKSTSAAAPAASASVEAQQAQFAGAESCKSCHEEVYDSWEKSAHWQQTYKEGGIAKHGCEDCHGPAASHVSDPTDTSKLFLFEKGSAKEIDARCLECHAGGDQHMNAINSVHAKNDVSCIACHSPHHGKESNFLLVKSQPELCYTCHLAKRAEFDMPFHHRVNEGLVQCTDCHNPHGTVKLHQVRATATQDEVCFKCHTDKQGPFVFEHQPVKVDGCESCHLV